MSPALLLVFFYVVAILEVSGFANSFLMKLQEHNYISLCLLASLCYFLTDVILSHSRGNRMKEQLEK